MLNTNYLEESVPDYTRTDLLAQKIRLDLGKYVTKRTYLSKFEIAGKLKLMGYCQKVAWSLACYFEDCFESAFNRGVFVVSSRTVTCDDAGLMAIQGPNELIAFFKSREPEHFDPVKWYLLRDFENELKQENYHADIIRELSAFVLRHTRAAFAVGMRGAATQLIH